MPVNYYPNKPIAVLIEILEGLQKRQTKGLLAEVAGAGIRTTREVGRGSANLNSRVETEILRVMYSLYVAALGTNEAKNWPNPYAQKIKRTRTHYTFTGTG